MFNVYAMRDRLYIGSFYASGTNQIEAQVLVATFVNGLCRGTVSQYSDLWKCRYIEIHGS